MYRSPVIPAAKNTNRPTFSQKWEWAEEGKSYREGLMPAALVNSLVLAIRIVDDESTTS
jgi:hypothetical protein